MNEEPLLKRTLRTAGIMVGACVLFLGALSVTAVILLRAPSGSSPEETPKTTSSKSKPS